MIVRDQSGIDDEHDSVNVAVEMKDISGCLLLIEDGIVGDRYFVVKVLIQLILLN